MIVARATRRTLTGLAIGCAAAFMAGPAPAAIVVINYTGITSTGEGAYIREQDFLAHTTVYTRVPSTTMW